MGLTPIHGTSRPSSSSVGTRKGKRLFSMFTLNRKRAEERHEIRLRRFMGLKVPTLTIGWYGDKKQLCSLCQELGYCRTTGRPVL